MSKPPIHFFSEEINYRPQKITALREWVLNTIHQEEHTLNQLNFIFCTDNYLLQINRQYLNHDDFTDIITFDNSDTKNQITGDIFISLERVKENSKVFKTTFINELHRVIIHGTLHLLGYKDKSAKEKKLMTEKEDAYLYLRKNM